MRSLPLCVSGLLLIPLQGCSLLVGAFYSCFVAGTRVLTPDGPRLIEDLAVGDLVLSLDTATNTRVVRPIVGLIRAEADSVWEVRAGSSVIAGVTEEHPFFDVTAQAFRPVVELSQKSRLLLHSGEGALDPVPLTRRRIVGTVAVYNLSVGGEEQNYFAEGLLVHNKSKDTGDDVYEDDTPFGVSVVWNSVSVDVTLTGGIVGYFGMAETDCLEDCWYGEDCLYGDLTATFFYCHSTNANGVSLLYGGAAEGLKEGAETVFTDDSFDTLTTYYVEQGGVCYVQGHDTSYYDGLGCIEL